MSTSPVQSLASGTPTTTVANPNANLNSSDFINMMLTELQNQDPLNPTDSQALLSQMSSIGQLQSADQLQTTLTQSNFQNQMASAGNLIGKTVAGLDPSQNKTSGVVTSISAVNNQVYLNLDNQDQVPLANVSTISPGSSTVTSAISTAAAATTPATTTTPTTQSTIASMLQGIVGAL
jgi:flagellar basal-body rod modification protein FlgD